MRNRVINIQVFHEVEKSQSSSTNLEGFRRVWSVRLVFLVQLLIVGGFMLLLQTRVLIILNILFVTCRLSLTRGFDEANIILIVLSHKPSHRVFNTSLPDKSL